jgi:hypothetical protein
MRLVLATNRLGLGGSESYLLAIAEQFDRLGHETIVFTAEPGAGGEVARTRGIEVAVGSQELDGDFDAALTQDAAVAYELAELRPQTPQLFVAHSTKFDLQTPPQIDDVAGLVVALNDRVAGRMRSLVAETRVVRLRQPIDLERFVVRGALPASPRRALLLSNNPNSDRLAMLEEACAEAGLELSLLGGSNGSTTDPRSALAGVEIVIGYGRSILEAMACGRAAYVYDWQSGDGWVTAQSYPAIEADGFAGGASGEVQDYAGLVEDLQGYSAAMGPVNHDLVVKHHRAAAHAQELVALLRELAPPNGWPRAPLEEMARLVRLEWRARADAYALADENAHLRGLLEESEKERLRMIDVAATMRKRAEQTAAGYEATASWRLTRPVRRLGGLLRRLRSRRD